MKNVIWDEKEQIDNFNRSLGQLELEQRLQFLQHLDKGGWHTTRSDVDGLLTPLMKHALRISSASANSTREEKETIKKACGDIANYCAMIYDLASQ